MGAIIHKMCERAEQELWDVLKEPVWSKEHAEIAFYLTEIMKGAKKIEHLKKLDETMDKYEEEEKEMKKKYGEEMPHQYMRNVRSMYDFEEDEDNKEDFARRMGRAKYYTQNYARGGNSSSGSSRGGGNSSGGNYNYSHPVHHNPAEWGTPPPIVYNLGNSNSSPSYYEEKYRELLEDKWEKEKKEKEQQQQQPMYPGKMPPPAK